MVTSVTLTGCQRGGEDVLKKTAPRKVFMVFNLIILISLCISILFPYINILAISLNDGNRAIPSGLMVWPRVFTLDNYRALLADNSIWWSLFVTVGRMVLGVGLTLFITFIAAYGLTRPGLPFRRTLVMFFFIPSQIAGGLIPTFILFNSLGLLNNPLVYVLPTGFAFFYYILFRTYITTIPDSLGESAKIDGANDFTIMWRIFLPLSAPIIAVIALFTGVFHWNDWTTTLFFMSGTNDWNTLAFELHRVLTEQQRINALIRAAIEQGTVPEVMRQSMESLKYAQIIITSLPIILLYPFLQKYFIKGIMLGGVKE